MDVHIYLQRHGYLNDVQTLESSLILIISSQTGHAAYLHSVSMADRITNLVEFLMYLKRFTVKIQVSPSSGIG